MRVEIRQPEEINEMTKIQNRTEQNRTKQNKTEYDRTEQNRTEQNRTEQSRRKQNRTLQDRIKQERVGKNSKEKYKTEEYKTEQYSTVQYSTECRQVYLQNLLCYGKSFRSLHLSLKDKLKYSGSRNSRQLESRRQLGDH